MTKVSNTPPQKDYVKAGIEETKAKDKAAKAGMDQAVGAIKNAAVAGAGKLPGLAGKGGGGGGIDLTTAMDDPSEIAPPADSTDFDTAPTTSASDAKTYIA